MAKMKFELIRITPTQARRWLEERNTGNRRVSQLCVTKLVRDINNGRWHQTPHPICFDENNRLIDGQHRLQAIVESGKPLSVWVCTNVPERSALFMDQGRKRSLADAGKFLAGDELTKKVESVTKSMADPMMTCGHTRMELWEFYEQHRSAIEYATNLFSGFQKSLQKSQLIAIVARASYSNDSGRLQQFALAIKEGMVASPGDRAAIMIRDHLMQGEFNGTADRREFYRMSEYRLTQYLLRKSRFGKKRMAEHEMFPIPGEDDYASDIAATA